MATDQPPCCRINLSGHAYATSARVGQEAMEGYKNLCARLEAERPNGDYPREDNLRGSRVQEKDERVQDRWNTRLIIGVIRNASTKALKMKTSTRQRT